MTKLYYNWKNIHTSMKQIVNILSHSLTNIKGRNMIRKITLSFRGLFLLLFLSVLTHAQDSGVLIGVITDQDSGEPIPGVQIYDASTSRGEVTDIDGKYSIELPAGNYNLTISFVGYSTIEHSVNVESGKTQTLDFLMKTDVFGLDNVVVTATFSERTVYNSPLSITNLKAKDLENLSASSQADVLRAVPGIHAEGGGGEVATNVFVRGMPSGGQYQFTPLQVDGLPVLSAFGLNSSAHDVYFRNDFGIRNLEFVRGGVSTLFGTGSVAGIINYSSYTGSEIPMTKLQYEWAEGGRSRMDFVTSGPMSDNTFYAFSGFYRYDEGPLETGLNTVGAQLRGNIKTLFNDGKGIFTVNGQYIDDKVQFYLPYPLANDGGEYSRPTGNDGETIYTLLSGDATDFSFETPNGTYHSQINDGVLTKGGYLMTDLSMNFENDWKLVAKARYANYDHQFNLFLDGDGTHNVPETLSDYLADRGLASDAVFTYTSTGEELSSDDLVFENRILDRTRPLEDIVADAHLSKKVIMSGAEHNFTLGIFSSYAKARDDNWIYSYLGDYSNSPEMVTLSYQEDGETMYHSVDGFISGSQTSNRYHTLKKNAIYAADEMVFDKLNVDIGFRYENATGFITRETGVGSNTFQKGTVETSDFAVAFAALYKLNSSINLYVNASKGYFFPEIRSVKFSSPGVTQSYETEKIYQGELGAKLRYNKFAGSIAAYYVGLNDRRAVDFENDGSGGIVEAIKVQSTATIGIEATGSYFITDQINLFGNLTFQNHELTEYESDPSLVGNWLRRQPQIMGMLGLEYDDTKIDARLTSNFIGKKYANDANTVELDAYNIVRADVGYTFALGDNQSMRLGVSAFNLLDADGVTEGSPRQGNSQISGGEFFVGRPILPRRIFVRATFEF